ncbi:DUF433 domain-containing protein [Microcoleus asticus]|jgi:uncharacterized protein (DUF433 family)|uniref:DUF433 domain-containing protein n=1 Tax=Microcoleus asticus IPMA8 TaxID=2563858 RepID=A0ABX2D096_9CYAN|nr:DUF433 domain-containing protein [Microcoleus asticus]NQE36071.1 hypothetical protein [Microcoleus asticus IPMA8]
MTQNNLLSRISIDSNICFGKPCIRGHRIWVSLILDFLASGMTLEELLEEYPGIEREDVLACIAYGAELARDYYVEIPLGEKNVVLK